MANTTTTTTETVGSFSMAGATIQGPADFMACPSGFAAIQARIESGSSVVFNYAAAQGSSVEKATLVAVQTHFAAWQGAKRDAARLAVVRASQERFLASMRGR